MKLTHSEYRRKLGQITDSIIPLENYVLSRIPIKHKCTKCKHVWKPIPNNLLKGSGCPRCCGQVIYEEDHARVVKLKHKYVEYIQGFTSGWTKATYKCHRHNLTFQMCPNKIVNVQDACVECRSERSRKVQARTTDEYKQELRRRYKGKIECVGRYVTTHTKIKHWCNSCKTHFVSAPSSVLEKRIGRTGCKNCNRKKVKVVRIKGKTFCVRGFEPQAISWILNSTGVKPSDIITERHEIPVIQYEYKGSHLHYPDIYIPKLNRLVEVKSSTTFGLTKSQIRKSRSEIFYSLCEKVRSAKRQGFSYLVLLMDQNGDRISLPKNWFDMKFRDFMQTFLGSHS